MTLICMCFSLALTFKWCTFLPQCFILSPLELPIVYLFLSMFACYPIIIPLNTKNPHDKRSLYHASLYYFLFSVLVLCFVPYLASYSLYSSSITFILYKSSGLYISLGVNRYSSPSCSVFPSSSVTSTVKTITSCPVSTNTECVPL